MKKLLEVNTKIKKLNKDFASGSITAALAAIYVEKMIQEMQKDEVLDKYARANVIRALRCYQRIFQFQNAIQNGTKITQSKIQKKLAEAIEFLRRAERRITQQRKE
ncbi:hypothetical protein [Bacillus sp. AG4(2022)]|uniref:hypothetical protein n=1 Tax=Bacillus sp. AG4(2022) TaxID=2962594 RepID=UPI0028824CD4|nr:hypothetical protein [Bacillus sp. AG4(2022)]MDT0161868.1 hypothetical protein [Bacillus sp. AG4(2022)]